MTRHLPAELAAAFVRELSADVKGVAVVGEHAEPGALAAPAAELARLSPHGSIRVEEGLAVVAEGTIVVAAGPHALAGPTALDAAAAVAALRGTAPGTPPEPLEQPSREVVAAARAVITAT